MKIVNNFRVFKKIIRKFYKKNSIRCIDHIRGKRFVSYWEYKDWLGFLVDNKEQINKEITDYIIFMIGDELYESKHNEIYSLLENKGIKVRFKEGISGIFNGLMLTNRDAYFLIDQILVPIFYTVEKK